MADTVDTKVIRNVRGRYVVRLTNESDGTGESGVAKVDISTLTAASGATATYSKVERIEYSVFGMNYVVLRWDHTTADEIAVLGGTGVIDASIDGGMVDPRSSGGTGDILLTTDGAVDGSGYDITLYLRMKA
jgi:hypothetical protein